MNKKDEFTVIRNHQDGSSMIVTETTLLSEAEDIFYEEMAHFRELTLNTEISGYAVTSIHLEVNGKVLEEHIRHYRLESDGD